MAEDRHAVPATASPAVAPAKKKSRKLRWILGGAGCLFLLGICVAIYQTTQIAKADKLYSDGSREEAVAIYKEYPWHLLNPSGKGFDALKRVVEFEVAKGNMDEARKWIKQALDKKLEVTYESKEANAILSSLRAEREAEAKRKLEEREAEAKRKQEEREAEAKRKQEEKEAKVAEAKAKKEAAEKEREATQNPSAARFKIGDEASFGDSKWTVLSAEDKGTFLKSNNAFQEDVRTNGRFVVVRFKVTNLTNEEQRILNTPKLIDSLKREFKDYDNQAFFIPDGAKTMVIEALPAGLQREFYGVYEVPADAKGLRFQARDLTSIFRPDYKLVELGF